MKSERKEEGLQEQTLEEQAEELEKYWDEKIEKYRTKYTELFDGLKRFNDLYNRLVLDFSDCEVGSVEHHLQQSFKICTLTLMDNVTSELEHLGKNALSRRFDIINAITNYLKNPTDEKNIESYKEATEDLAAHQRRTPHYVPSYNNLGGVAVELSAVLCALFIAAAITGGLALPLAIAGAAITGLVLLFAAIVGSVNSRRNAAATKVASKQISAECETLSGFRNDPRLFNISVGDKSCAGAGVKPSEVQSGQQHADIEDGMKVAFYNS